MVPCVIFEDEHLLAVNKPAGWNTHSPAPCAGEGIYDWLRNREPRWASLAIIHRLDKETSGVLVFGKTPLANRSLTEQFARHRIQKKYLLLTDRAVPRKEFTAKSSLQRAGDKYVSRAGGEPAETRFVPVAKGGAGAAGSERKMVIALPLTGRTHQIRVHAAEHGFPVLGDTLYGGTPAGRVFLHAAEIVFAHPATNTTTELSAPPDFDADPRLALRAAIIEPEATNAYRLIHGASDGWPGWHVDRLGSYLLSQSEKPVAPPQWEKLARLAGMFQIRGVYHKILSRRVRQATPAAASPQLLFGEPAAAPFEILENGVSYELSFSEGYSTGLFLDQRDNRRRLLTGHVAAKTSLPPSSSECQMKPLSNPPPSAAPSCDHRCPGFEMLNVFAYTCGFSICAAKAGARTTSLDLSKKYLDWGRRNFVLNGLDPAEHDFIYGDAFDWLRRLAKRGRTFDVVVLDPPTFSQSKDYGVFRVEKNFGELLAAALRLIRPGGICLASANAAQWPAEDFLASLKTTVGAANQVVANQVYIPQPPDYPVSRAEPAYLKTLWIKLE